MKPPLSVALGAGESLSMLDAIDRWENEGGATLAGLPVSENPAATRNSAMTPTIIIDFNNREHGLDALALARSLGELNDARLVAVTSYPCDRYGMLPALGWHWARQQRTNATIELARTLLADEPGASARLVGAISPAHALHETAEREQASLIIVSSATTRRGGSAFGAGGRQALEGAPCAVAVAPAGFARSGAGLTPVGVGFDGSSESRLALASAAGLADTLEGALRVISALQRPPEPHSMLAFTNQRQLEAVHVELRSRLIEAVDTIPVCPEIDPISAEGEPAHVLAEQSKELGLLVIGSRGYGPWRRLLLGSVSHALLDRAHCPLMIVPRGAAHPYGSLGLDAAATSR